MYWAKPPAGSLAAVSTYTNQSLLGVSGVLVSTLEERKHFGRSVGFWFCGFLVLWLFWFDDDFLCHRSHLGHENTQRQVVMLLSRLSRFCKTFFIFIIVIYCTNIVESFPARWKGQTNK